MQIPVYNMGRTRGRLPRGKVSSISACSASVRAQISGACVVEGVRGARGLGDREERRPPYEEPQRNLPGGRGVDSRNLLQHAASARIRTGKLAPAERTICDHRDTVLLAPGDYRVLDGASCK